MTPRFVVHARGLALLVEVEAEYLLDSSLLPPGPLRELLGELRDTAERLYESARDLDRLEGGSD